MKAIVFADRSGHELDVLCRDTCPALLHIAAKPVVEYTIEDLARAGVHDITLVICPMAAAIRQQLGDGGRWGVQLRYTTSRPGERAGTVMQRLSLAREEAFLCLRGDILRSTGIAEFIAMTQERDHETMLCARSGSRNAWLMVARAACMDYSALDPARQEIGADVPEAVNLAGMRVESLGDSIGYFRACLKASRGLIRGLSLPGFPMTERQQLGRFSKAPTAGSKLRRMHVGHCTSIADSVTSAGTVVVGSNCMVDERTHLADCVVMPDTYVGADLDVSNAIVGPGYMMRFDLGVTVPIDDPLWSASMQQAGKADSSTPGGRLAALCVLLLSLPLWPLALFASLAESMGAPLRRRSLIGNRHMADGTARTFVTLEFTTRVPILRHLPLLWAAVCGHLQLLGARPRTVDSGNHANEWEMARANLPAGVLGPCQLRLQPDAPEEEIYLNEVLFNEDRSALQTIACMREGLALLFNRRAWLQARDGA